eukprot:9348656-Ditylum_brightwellii.AAC.1
MPSLEGDVSDATATDDGSTIITKATRRKLLEQYWLFPYVTGADMSVPTEISFHDAMATDHAAMHRTDAHLFEEAMKEEMVVMEELGVWKESDEAEVPYTSKGIWCLKC